MKYAVLLLALLAASCAPYANGEMASLIPNAPWADKPDMNEYYPQTARIMADEMDAQLVSRLGLGQGTSRGLQWLIVTTPADINDMTQATPLSRALAEELGAAMTAKGYYVQEIRKTSEVVFNKSQGEFMLSRDVKQLATKRFQGTLVMTGTYVSSPYGVRFNIEVMDARNNDVLAKSSKVIPMSKPVAFLQQPQTPGQSNVHPSVVTRPGMDTSVNPYAMPQGDWRTDRQKIPNFLQP